MLFLSFIKRMFGFVFCNPYFLWNHENRPC